MLIIRLFYCVLLALSVEFAPAANTCHRAIFSLNVNRGGSNGLSHTSTVAPGGAQESDSPLKLFVRTIKDARRHLVAAAAARTISIVAMYPVDTIKVR